VLRHPGAGRRRDECRGRRDVERVRTVATRAGRVHEIVSPRVHSKHVLAHRFRAARDLVRGLALRPQRHEEAADLGRRRLAAHDRAHDRARLFAAQVVAVEQSLQGALDHRSSRKFRAIVEPSGVSTDSGWN
jgi:hypothetical protein